MVERASEEGLEKKRKTKVLIEGTPVKEEPEAWRQVTLPVGSTNRIYLPE